MAQYFSSDQWVDSYIGAVRDLVARPGKFFGGLPQATAYGPSLMFLTVTLAVPLLIYALLSFGIALLIAPFLWLLIVVSNWLWAWYLGWAVRSFTQQQLSTVQAFQICAYANAPMLLSWLPVIGVLITVWSVVLQWFGLTRSCNVGSGAAMAILLLPLLVLSISLGILIVLLGIYAAQHGIQIPQMPQVPTLI